MNQSARNFALHLLRAYQWALSPLLPVACRYVPTCSDYAIEAVDRYGVFRGSLMAMSRLLRCHPFVQGGYDPVVKSPDMHSIAKFKDYGVTNTPPASCAVTE
jgi:putative membrane protein insertion efficiency factor